MSKLKIPPAEANGFVPTLNKMGYMTSSLDYFSKSWVEFAGQTEHPVLDIGAAYGIATLAALKNGAQVIANDIEPSHLELLAEQAPSECKDNLKTVAGAFPDQLDFADNSLGGILICRVLHFFDGPRIEESFKKLSKWLAPGGQLYAITETPYLRNFQEFIPEYERRVAEGWQYPGFVEDVMEVAPERGANLPKTIHFLSPEVFTRLAQDVGIEVIEAKTIARKDFPEDLAVGWKRKCRVDRKKAMNTKNLLS